MLSSPVVSAAVKGISRLDSDNSAGGGRKKPGLPGSEPPAKGSAASSNYDPTDTAPEGNWSVAKLLRDEGPGPSAGVASR